MFLPGCDLVGFPQKKLKWGIKSQVNVPLMVHKFLSDSTSKGLIEVSEPFFD